MSAFLYVCSVQGIQDFIFQSNVLKEIIGASELVKCVENLAQSDDKIALQKRNLGLKTRRKSSLLRLEICV